MSKKMMVISFYGLLFLCPSAMGQATSPAIKEELVSRPIKAVNYKVLGGSTTIDFKPTDLLPGASGEAKVESKQGFIRVDAKFRDLPLASKFGSEYLTYVLWSVSTEGRVANLGELLLKNGESKLEVTTQLQVFALAVTAEPYFAVRRPSTKVVLINEPRDKVKGKLFLLDAQFDLLEWDQYRKLANPLGMTLDLKKYPLELYEARNAIHIAQSLGAEKYAPDIYSRAKSSLELAEYAVARKQSKKEIATNARQAVQFAEDARTLSLNRQREEALARQRESEARAKAEAEKAEEERKDEAERRARAEATAAQEAQRRAEAEAARVRAQAEQEQAQQAEELARQSAAQAAREKAELRARLLQQFNAILETRDTDRGLVINMGDVLFDTGRYSLRPLAREKLARLSGIVLNYPGLKLEAEGHTDNVGSEAFNQNLSEQRANAVREYLISQGIASERVTAVGKGFSMPVADNKTAEGRQRNRRVELIVSGEVIGTKIESIR
jgi:outer membrane protein OmpA-like peptidoglycan-associated protein